MSAAAEVTVHFGMWLRSGTGREDDSSVPDCLVTHGALVMLIMMMLMMVIDKEEIKPGFEDDRVCVSW